MARKRNPNRDLAYELFKKAKGKLTCRAIAEELNEKESNIKLWRREDKWINKGGAPKGNKNALGNVGQLKHGMYCDESRFLDKGFLAKYIPASTKSIIKGIVEDGISGLDMMWDNIMLLYSSIIRSQKIMYVKNQNDLTKELKKSKVKNKDRSTEKTSSSESEEEYEYELQFAWDKQERFIKAQSTAMKTLNSMIKDYEDLLHKNWDYASEEQKLRVDKLKLEIDRIKGEDSKDTDANTKLDSILKQLE